MKTSAASLIVLGAVLLAGPSLAQNATLNSSGATIAAETRVTSRDGPSAANTEVSSSQGADFLQRSDDHIDQDAQVDAPAVRRGALPSTGSAGPAGSGPRAGVAGEPINGIGGTGGGRLRVINNSETDTAQVEGSYRAGSSSNRDHIDQDAQTDIRRRPSQAQTPGSTGGETRSTPDRLVQTTNSRTEIGIGDASNRDHIDQDARSVGSGGPRVGPLAAAGSTGGENGADRYMYDVATDEDWAGYSGGTGGGRYTFAPVAGGRVALRGSSALPIGITNEQGRVSATLRAEPGTYEVTVACPARAPCRLTSVSVDGRALNADARGQFVLTVGPGAQSLRLRVSADVSTLR